MEKVMLGAGCFWGVEEYFKQLPGVSKTSVGYTGGQKDNPTYEDVCTDESGHAEVIYIEFDPKVLPFATLLEHFWRMHDPTTLNRQGPDRGSQYRSAIFYYSPEQKKIAEESKLAFDKTGEYRNPVVTTIEAAQTYYPAETYHQRYFEKRGGGGCHVEFPAYSRK